MKRRSFGIRIAAVARRRSAARPRRVVRRRCRPDRAHQAGPGHEDGPEPGAPLRPADVRRRPRQQPAGACRGDRPPLPPLHRHAVARRRPDLGDPRGLTGPGVVPVLLARPGRRDPGADRLRPQRHGLHGHERLGRPGRRPPGRRHRPGPFPGLRRHVGERARLQRPREDRRRSREHPPAALHGRRHQDRQRRRDPHHLQHLDGEPQRPQRGARRAGRRDQPRRRPHLRRAREAGRQAVRRCPTCASRRSRPSPPPCPPPA